MQTWWGSLGTALQVFYAIAITATAVLLIQMILLIFGFDGDGDVDSGDGDLSDVEGHGGSVLSVRTIIAFFAGFGWTGVAMLEAGYSIGASLAASLVVGGGFMAGVVVMMRVLYGMRQSGTLDYHNAIGVIGTVYLRVPAAMKSPGQVEVTVQGRLRVVAAFTRAQDDLPNQTRVKVIDVLDQNTLIVEPLTASSETGEEA